jgi:hypothetical protein
VKRPLKGPADTPEGALLAEFDGLCECEQRLILSSPQQLLEVLDGDVATSEGGVVSGLVAEGAMTRLTAGQP